MAWKTRVKSVCLYDIKNLEKEVNKAIEELEGEVGNLVIRDIKVTPIDGTPHINAMIIYEIH
ncbi:MAG: hypothetical protein NC131_12400 [Roseburia sp.]|nr:hypothetical protein [Roseburia sp.]